MADSFRSGMADDNGVFATTIDGTTSNSSIQRTVILCENTEVAAHYIKEHEKKYTVQYVHILKKFKHFGMTDIFAKRHWIRWMTEDIPFSGVPFISLNQSSMECCLGKNRRLNKYIIRTSKKIDCPAQVKLFEIATFRTFEIDKDTSLNRRKMAKLLSVALDAKLSSLKFERKIVLVLPDIKEHKGHFIGEAAGVSHTIDKSVAEKIKDLVQHHGMTNVKEITTHLNQYVQEMFRDELPTANDQRYYPTEKNIRNHCYAAVKKLKKSMIDVEVLVDKLQQLAKERFNINVYFRPGGESSNTDSSTDLSHVKQQNTNVIGSEKNISKSSLLLVYQEEYQRQLLVRYGNELVFLHATHRIISYALPLYFLVVKTNMDYQIVATVMSESEETLEEALDVIRAWNPEWNPIYFMTDYNKEEIDVVQKVFDTSNVYLCDFLRELAWQNWFNRNTDNCLSIQGHLIPMMRSIARSTCERDMEAAISMLKSSCFWHQKNAFKCYFAKNWLEKKELWIWAYRKTRLLMGLVTNDGIDRQNVHFQYDYLAKRVNNVLSDMFMIIVDEYFPTNFNKYLDANKAARLKYGSEIQHAPFLVDRPPSMVEHCMSRINRAYHFQKKDIIPVGHGEFHVHHTVQNETEEVYKVVFGDDFNMPSCTCEDWITSFYPCRHFFAIMHIYSDYWPWQTLSSIYRSSPFLTLDIEEEDTVGLLKSDEEVLNFFTEEDNAVEDQVSQNSEGGESSSANTCQTLLREIGNIASMIDQPSLFEALQNTLEDLRDELTEQICPENMFLLKCDERLGQSVGEKRSGDLLSNSVKKKCIDTLSVSENANDIFLPISNIIPDEVVNFFDV